MSGARDAFGSKLRRLPRGSARIGPIRSLPALLRARGIDPAWVFAQAQIDPSLFDDPENVIAYHDIGRVLAVSAAAMHCPHVGVLIGERCGVADLGLVGSLAAHAADVGTALRDFVRHMPLFDRAAVVSLAVDGDVATFTYTIVEPDIPAPEQIREGSVAIMVHVLRDLCGPSWAPDIVMFPHRLRGPLRPYRRYFRAPVHFGVGIAGIVFPARWLRQAIPNADGTLRYALLTHITAATPASDGPFADQVRRQIQLAMPRARADETVIARALGMDRSTLRRRLMREGSSFRTIVQDIRYQTARHLIHEAGLPLAEIATTLGYAELSVFTRAFRRWAGMTPSEWRRRHAEC